MTTLGFERPDGLGREMLAVVEASLGLGLVALLISYLPTIYTAFQRRERVVGGLQARMGLPPSPVKMYRRYVSIGWLDRVGDDIFPLWEGWFVDIEESHTSQPWLVFFRSPHPERSWITTAGAVLDLAALHNAVVDLPHDPRADLFLRAGYLSLRRIADSFGIRYDADPRPDDPITRDPRGVRRGVRAARRVRRAADRRPRPGLARLRRLAGQLRHRARGAGDPRRRPAGAVVERPRRPRADADPHPPPALSGSGSTSSTSSSIERIHASASVRHGAETTCCTPASA